MRHRCILSMYPPEVPTRLPASSAPHEDHVMSFPPHRHTTGLTRREVLQVGYSGLLGIGLTGLLAKQSRAASAPRGQGGKAKSVVIVFLTGGPSHIDTFDLKPDAPAEIRGEFKPSATKIPGVSFCEHLPRFAVRAD